MSCMIHVFVLGCFLDCDDDKGVKTRNNSNDLFSTSQYVLNVLAKTFNYLYALR